MKNLGICVLGYLFVKSIFVAVKTSNFIGFALCWGIVAGIYFIFKFAKKCITEQTKGGNDGR